MKKILLLALPLLLVACATPKPEADRNPSPEAQRAAQALVSQPTELALKRKIAVGRISNETQHGRSLLRDSSQDELGRKVSDMFMQSLANSNNFLVFERPDLDLLEREAQLVGRDMNLIGVDTLVVGSLSQFGRANTGESGFLRSSRTQEATATIDLRLIDTRTAQVYASVTGSGSSATTTTSTMGFGSVAGYDGSLNDRAIAAAVNAAVEKLTLQLASKGWTADVLEIEGNRLYISGGKSQGVQPGMVFDITTRGRQVTSSTTGGTITLPGQTLGRLRIDSTFGQTELEEGAIGTLISGNLANQTADTLLAVEIQ